MATNAQPIGVIARLLDLSERRIQQLSREGVIPKADRGQYDLVGAVRGYVAYLRDLAVKAQTGAPDFGVERARVHQEHDSGVGHAEFRHAGRQHRRPVLRGGPVAVDNGLDLGFRRREREHAVAEAVEVGRAVGLLPLVVGFAGVLVLDERFQLLRLGLEIVEPVDDLQLACLR